MEFGFLSFTIAEMCTHMNAMIRIRTAIRLMRKRHDGSDRPPTRPGIERTICAWRWQWAKKRATCAGAATLRRGCSASLQTWNRAATRRNLPKIRTKGHSEIWLTRWSACDVTIRLQVTHASWTWQQPPSKGGWLRRWIGRALALTCPLSWDLRQKSWRPLS